MLDIERLTPTEVERAASVFHRDGFVAIENALTREQLTYAQSGAARVIAQQMADIPLEKANRGYARYSFGAQIHHPEWAQLVDVPTILPILDKIWGNSNYICSGAGGDYSTPGAKNQHLHADIGDVFNDPLGQVTIRDVPSPYIVVNYLMVEFKEINGAIRFVPGTHRSRQPIPTLEAEPERMKRSIVCAPAGTAIIRDVRCWHGGTANNSDEIRPMMGFGYLAPWFRLPHLELSLPRGLYETLSPRAQTLCRFIVKP
ncbi:phytanoyl-CoA dioxygenase family protein [Candidatus Poribacteria bacterium]|nr:phytanoyl-CoA dioxygenase family protein [Candidatus Poribacteria bacterium]